MNCHEKSLSKIHIWTTVQSRWFMDYSKELSWELATVVTLRITYVNNVRWGGETILFLHRKSQFSF